MLRRGLKFRVWSGGFEKSVRSRGEGIKSAHRTKGLIT